MRSPYISPITRFLNVTRPAWEYLIGGLLLAALPAVAAALDGMLRTLITNGLWRAMMLPVAIIYYIWLVSPIVDRSQATVVHGFRRVVQLDDSDFDNLVWQSSFSSLGKELLAFSIGAVLGFLLGRQGVQEVGLTWLQSYWIVSNSLMYGLLSWTVYASIQTTRLTTALHRQPLAFDLFDLTPFEPVGRLSLVLAVVFIGGLTLALLLGLSSQNIYQWETWIFYLPMALIPLALFFMNMRGTHAVLAAEKRRLLAIVARKLQAITPELNRALSDGGAITESAAQFAYLSAYEARLQVARTWPYNTSMLRTLAFSILLPMLIRLVSVLLFE